MENILWSALCHMDVVVPCLVTLESMPVLPNTCPGSRKTLRMVGVTVVLDPPGLPFPRA